jgi:hypothetical protein
MSFDLIITGITAVEIEKFTPADPRKPAKNLRSAHRQIKLPLFKTIISFILHEL